VATAYFFILFRLPLAVAGLHFFGAQRNRSKEMHRKWWPASRIPEVGYKFSGAAELAALKQSSRLPR
jgi:hypothetical protein